MKKTRFPIKYLIPIPLALAIGGIALLLYRPGHLPNAMQEDYSHIMTLEYNTAFLSMYPIDTYHEEDFTHYRGLTLFKASYCIPDLSVLEDYLDRIADSGNEVAIVYLGIRPDLVTAEELQSLLSTYPSVHFEIILSYPSAQYWRELSPADCDEILEAYCSFLTAVPKFDLNTAVYFYNTQEWLVSNPGNYKEAWQVTEPIALTIMLHSDHDHAYRVTADNAFTLTDTLTAFTGQLRASTAELPCLADYCIVFFGDSIIGNFTDSTSISGVVNGLTGARVYNLGHSGDCASLGEATLVSLPVATDAFFSGDLSMLPTDSLIYQNLSSYLEDPQEYTKLYFVINYGLNDYFFSHPVSSGDPYDLTTYSGAIRTAVDTIRTNAPDAEIILCTPTPTTLCQNGTEPKSDEGYILEDYADAVLALSQELNTDVLDNYHDLDITPENETQYLSDRVHPTAACRYLIGNRIAGLLR